MENIHTQRINTDILRVLSMALLEKAQNPDLALVTIMKVETSSDYSFAKIHVDINGDDNDKKRVLTALLSAAPFLRGEIAENVKMRRIPALKFVIDKGRENAERVEEILKTIRKGG